VLLLESSDDGPLENGVDGVMRVPTGWLPHVDRDKIYWFWTPATWSATSTLSKGSFFALLSREEGVYMEVFVFEVRRTKLDPAGFVERMMYFMKRALVEGHAPDLRTIREGVCQLDEVDGPDALSRMYALDLMGVYGFLTELCPATTCHRLTVEYAELVSASFGMTVGNEMRKTTTDCFFLNREDLVLQLNMKALSSDYDVLASTFEQVAASAKLGSVCLTC
jgi:hypothetical protein